MIDKRCFKCGEIKPLDEFYPHPQMGDGHLNKCKECARRDSRIDHHKYSDDPEWVQKQRERGREKYRRLYRGRPQRRTATNEERAQRQRETRAARPVEYKARGAVARAVKRGQVAKPSTCERCGTDPGSRQLHGHHHDYSKPLDVEWICTTCHGKEHRAA